MAKVLVGWVGVAMVLVASSARAQGTVEGTIVRIDGDDVLVDVGASEARAGLVLDIYRRIEVRHPVTRRMLRDRFVIGRVVVVQAGETLSIARVQGTPSRAVAVGDGFEGRVAPSQVAPRRAALPATSGVTHAEPGAPLPDPETSEVLALWHSTLGRAPEERARLYEVWLASWPDSPYAGAVGEEIRALRALLDGALGPRPAPAPDLRRAVATTLLEQVRDTDPVELAFAITRPDTVEALLVYVRSIGEPTYELLDIVAEGGTHVRAAVPARLVTAPGFEYFVEAVGPAGVPVSIVASSAQPARVDVLPSARPTTAHLSRVRFSSEIISFNGVQGNDWYSITEGDFLYRTRFHQLYGVRLGYGHMIGKGGTVVDLDERGLDPEPAGFSYGFIETELRFHELFALMARVSVGLGQVGVGERSGVRGGVQLRARIGPEEGTNLVVAGETTPEVGQRAFLALAFEVLEGWPMAAEVHVTDQPINSDELAVRAVFELGFRGLDPLALAVRLSYQGRTIDHAGFGAGLAATFDW